MSCCIWQSERWLTMNYIENIFVCLAAPLAVAIICVRSPGRTSLLFVLGGMTACLLSSYISTFLASAFGIDYIAASITLTPVVEETMKMLPLLFYLLVFEPEKEYIPGSVIMTAAGFATFENVCYLIQNGTSEFFSLLIRGFGTGAMHIVCGVIIITGLMSLWDKRWLRAAGTAGLLAAVVTYHGIYNMLVLQSGIVAYIGYLIPLISSVIIILSRSLTTK